MLGLTPAGVFSPWTWGKISSLDLAMPGVVAALRWVRPCLPVGLFTEDVSFWNGRAGVRNRGPEVRGGRGVSWMCRLASRGFLSYDGCGKIVMNYEPGAALTPGPEQAKAPSRAMHSIYRPTGKISSAKMIDSSKLSQVLEEGNRAVFFFKEAATPITAERGGQMPSIPLYAVGQCCPWSGPGWLGAIEGSQGLVAPLFLVARSAWLDDRFTTRP